ncbi:DNA methyltransferase [Gordonia sp. GONU]|uniref:site-specific DNA-methyltransferase n=1 Tax=Gordonia sp. GONU TaxID=2972949 RepID=UPI0021AC16B0|nr:DNA methyltransferase [Gordonia sp. GONU]MCR8897179.1 DNA methyltransferase [Gordonia sp. GONU]
MSRLNDLLRQVANTDPQLAKDLRRETDALADRRAFGLNFERHTPEAVELPGRPIRKNDKVRILPERGKTPKKEDERLYRVTKVYSADGDRCADVVAVDDPDDVRSVIVDDLVVVAEFRDPIYPGLLSTGKIERGKSKPFHTVINSENYHALQALLFTHRGKVDCIYIDPPYNTGAKDWKYNNDYVESDDHYRHSKWLAFIERRLVLARELLNPDESVLIVTIDEKEYLRLGLLLEQVFPGARVQMVSSAINPTGAIRTNEFTRTNEFIYFVMIGDIQLIPEVTGIQDGEEVRWNQLRRFEMSSARNGPQPRPDQFYPIYVNKESGRISEVGNSIPRTVDRHTVPGRDGCVTLWPLKPDGTEMIWGLTPATLRSRIEQGYVRVSRGRGRTEGDFSVSYLTSGKLEQIRNGTIKVLGRRQDGSVIVERVGGLKRTMPTTQWQRESHSAQAYGTKLISNITPNRRFPFPKSLYAVEDALRLFVADNPSAVILDFFSGSGTTAHAVLRLNKQDGGHRRSISITNNEVSQDEQYRLRESGLRPGDAEWERWGICDYITKPRIAAAITGRTPDREPIKGDYKFTDEFPMADGFEENVEFFTLTYESAMRVASHREFAKIAPFLWLRAGARGRRIDEISVGWDVADTYGVIANLDLVEPFLKAVEAAEGITHAYIVTDEDRLFEALVRQLPEHVEPVRLYSSYLRNFEIEAGRAAR